MYLKHKIHNGSPSTTFIEHSQISSDKNVVPRKEGGHGGFRNKSGAGFTVIEILAVIAIFGVLFAVVVSSMSKFRDTQVIVSGANQISSLLNEARSSTLSSKNSLQYGVRFSDDGATLFSYDPSEDIKSITVNGAITISQIVLSGGGSEIIFEKLTGKTNQSGFIILGLKSEPSTIQKITIDQTGLNKITQ